MGQIAEDQQRHGIVHSGSISSSVDLDYDSGLAHKVYRPGRLVRALYWLAFQAPFPYVASHDALEAARQQRTLVGLLTKVWYGEDLVAGVRDVVDAPAGGHDFVTTLVRGHSPKDRRSARRFLAGLTRHFIDAGLPTWQVTPFNPHNVTNFLELEDGSYRLIDLESSLVPLLYPLSAIAGRLRTGQVPTFDDIEVCRLRSYLARHEHELEARLTNKERAALERAAAGYAEALEAWHRSEPRLLNKSLRFLFRLIDLPGWVRGMRRGAEGGGALATAFIVKGVETWQAEDRLTAAQATELRDTLKTAEVATVLAHMGAHFAISVPLRFPFGAAARFLWTLAMRLRAELAALAGGGGARAARETHTLVVALLALLPGIGRLAYLAARPLRTNSALVMVALDRVLRALPLRVYERWRLWALTTWFARPKKERPALTGLSPVPRLRAIAARWPLTASIAAANVSIGAAAAISGRNGEVLGAAAGGEAVLGAIVAILAFAAFWRRAHGRGEEPLEAGIFLWPLAGISAVVFTIDGLAGLHGGLLDWAESIVGNSPVLSENTVDLFDLGFGAWFLLLVYLFRFELLALRASAATLGMAFLAIAGLVIAHGYLDAPPPHGFDLIAWQAAAAMLLLAALLRLREVREDHPLRLPAR